MTATTNTLDFLGRLLVNANPGMSAATDFLGRAVADPLGPEAGNETDYLGRATTAR